MQNRRMLWRKLGEHCLQFLALLIVLRMSWNAYFLTSLQFDLLPCVVVLFLTFWKVKHLIEDVADFIFERDSFRIETKRLQQKTTS
jgi:hypothetical protein